MAATEMPEGGTWTAQRGFASYWLRRLRQDPALQRRAKMVAIFVLAFVAEAFILRTDLPAHRETVKHVVVWAALLALPVTMCGIVGRLPWAQKRWPTRITVRPFESLSHDPKCKGTAIAYLLDREIGGWLSQPNRSKGMSKAEPSPTLSAGGASITLEWLWPRLKHLLTGNRDVYIDGVLLDQSTPYRLRVSMSNCNWNWQETINEGDLYEKLTEAIVKLAFEIFTQLEPKRAAYIDSYRWRDAEAIQIMRGQDLTEDERMGLFEIYFNAGYLAEADEVLQSAKRILRSRVLCLDAAENEVQLKINQGDFASALTMLRSLRSEAPSASPRRFRTALALADGTAYQFLFEDAIVLYEAAFQEFLAICEATLKIDGVQSESRIRWERLSERITDGLRDSQREEISDLLGMAFSTISNKSRCRMLLRLLLPPDDAESAKTVDADLLLASEIHNSRTLLVDASDLDLPAQGASLAALCAQLYLPLKQFEEGISAVDQAIDLRDALMPALERELARDPLNMKAKADLAWCFYGRAKVFLMRYRILEGWNQQKTEAREQENKEREQSEQEAADVSAELNGIAELAELYYNLPAEDANLIEKMYVRATTRDPGPSRTIRLWDMADSMAAALMRQRGTRVLDISEEIRAAQTDEDGSKETGPFYKSKETTDAQVTAGLDKAETYRLIQFLFRRLEMRSTSENVEAGNLVWGLAEAQFQMNDAGAKARQHFLDLKNFGKRADAESAYGLACIEAITGNGAGAAALLEEARKLAGEKTFSYRNRSILDEDFDAVRTTKEFSEMMGWPPAQDAADEGQRAEASN